MVDIIPFKGLIYNPENAGNISDVISPPYDIISEKKKKSLLNASKYNIAKILLPEPNEGINKYKYSRDLLDKWIGENILSLDNEKCFYLIELNFKDKGKDKKILGFIGLTRIEDYESGHILRHEKTLSKPKEDRLNLIRHCDANFGLIYTIYNNNDLGIRNIIKSESDTEPYFDFVPGYDNSLRFKLWKIIDQDKIKQIINGMKDTSILIADGHHRYETSRIYKEESINLTTEGKKHPEPQDYILTLFVDANQEGLVLHPTHRVFKIKGFNSYKEFLSRLEGKFDIKEIDSVNDNNFNSIMDFDDHSSSKKLIFYFKDNRTFQVTHKTNSDLNSGDIQDLYDNLDVSILHEKIFNQIIDKSNIDNIMFLHTINRLKQLVDDDMFDLGVMLKGPSLESVDILSKNNYIMPQKSTYFYPKPCSGLVMYKF